MTLGLEASIRDVIRRIEFSQLLSVAEASRPVSE